MKSPHQYEGIQAALKERQRYAASVLRKIDEKYPILSQGKIVLSPEAAQVVYPAVEVEL